MFGSCYRGQHGKHTDQLGWIFFFQFLQARASLVHMTSSEKKKLMNQRESTYSQAEIPGHREITGLQHLRPP